MVSLLFSVYAFAEKQSLTSISPATLKIGTSINQVDGVPAIHQVPGQSNFLRNFIAPPFIHLDADWHWQCRVCVRMPDAPADGETDAKGAGGAGKGLTTQWEISSRVNWADGAPVTGFDVQFTLNHLRKLQKDPGAQESFPVKEIVVDPQNPRKFSLTVKHSYVDSYQVLAISLLPAHKRELLESPKESPEGRVGGALTELFWSYGPYRINSAFGNSVTLIPNERFGDGSPGFKKIVMQFFAGKAEMLKALQTGAIDMIADGELTVDDVALLRQGDGARASIKVLGSPSNELEQITLNLRNPMFGDSRLRKALIVGMNRGRIVTEIYQNHALLADSFLHPKDPLFVAPSGIFSYRPDIAAALLDDAGWKLGPGAKRMKNGHLLSLQIATRPDPTRKRIIAAIREDWQKLGIEVTTEEIADSESFHEYIQSARFRDVAFYSWLALPGGIPFSQMYSAQIPSSRNEYAGQNVGAWTNGSVDAALVELLFPLEASERQKLITTILNEWISDIPFIPITFKPRFVAFAAGFDGYLLPGNGYHSSIYCELWRPSEEIHVAK